MFLLEKNLKFDPLSNIERGDVPPYILSLMTFACTFPLV